MNEPVPLPIHLHPSSLRPIAYRILSKKYGLNIKSGALEQLADYIGNKFGNNWRSTKSFSFLEDVAKLWKQQDKGVFLDGDAVRLIITQLTEKETVNKRVSFDALIAGRSDTIMDSPTQVFSDSPATDINWQDFFAVLSASSQPPYKYNHQRKHYELIKSHQTRKLHLPSIQSRNSLFLVRYHIILERLLRNENFQNVSFSSLNSITGSVVQPRSHPITAIKNLLGRHGQRFLLFGYLTLGSTSYKLEDHTDSIELDVAQCTPASGAFYCVGNFVLCDGIYSSSGKFYVSSMGHPPAEKRSITMEAYGNIDFNGITPQGKLDDELQKRLISLERELFHHKLVVLGGNCDLANLKTRDGLTKFFAKISKDIESHTHQPLAIVFNGPFTSVPFDVSPYNSSHISTESSSASYKSYFDALAALLESFPLLTSANALITFVFVPGENDPWSSLSSQGACLWPQEKIPAVFTSRLVRALKHRKVHFCSNPAKINYLSQSIVLCRDDLKSSFTRRGIVFPTVNETEDQADQPPADVVQARKLVKTLLDQGHLSPFPHTDRPIRWDMDHALQLSPLPSLLILADPSSPPFDVTYDGCHVVNPGALITGNVLNYMEYVPSTKKCFLLQVPI